MKLMLKRCLAGCWLGLSLFLSAGLAEDHEAGGPEVIKHRTNPHRTAAVPKGSTGVVTPSIAYHGGALIQNPIIYYIWYGNWNQSNSSDTPGGQDILRHFARSIGTSDYFKINSTYCVDGTYPCPSFPGAASFGGETTDAYSYGKKLKDSSILNIVNNAIKNGKLPYDINGVYFVLTSSDVSELSGFCNLYCGWHTAATPSAGHIRYSFVGNANRCLNACSIQTVSPNGNPGVDAMVSIIAHELEEATTDADPRSGWVDSKGAENADKCAWTFGQALQTAPNGSLFNVTLTNPQTTESRNYLIQRNLKHSASGDTCNMDLTKQ